MKEKIGKIAKKYAVATVCCLVIPFFLKMFLLSPAAHDFFGVKMQNTILAAPPASFEILGWLFLTIILLLFYLAGLLWIVVGPVLWIIIAACDIWKGIVWACGKVKAKLQEVFAE